MDGVLYLCSDDVAALDLSIVEVVDAVETAFRLKGGGLVDMPPKVTMQGSDGAFAQVMPAWMGAATADDAVGADMDEQSGDSLPGSASLLGVKLVTIMPGNARRGLPVTNALILLDDPSTGLPRAIVDGGRITALRTGAAVGVAARHLAVGDVACVGVLGCGIQARAAARALASVLPELRDVRCHDVVPAVTAAFAEELPRLVEADDAAGGRRARQMSVRVCARPDDVCRGAGVVVTAITMGGGESPLGAGLLEPGALAVALDYDAAWKPAAMAECDLFVTDDVNQTLSTREHGPRLAGIPALDADLGAIVAERTVGRTGPGQRIFCLSLGVAVADLVTAELVRERATRLGLGLRLPV